MVTNREIRDALIGVRALSDGLIDRINLFPGKLDEAKAQVSNTWFHEFTRATAQATCLLVNVIGCSVAGVDSEPAR